MSTRFFTNGNSNTLLKELEGGYLHPFSEYIQQIPIPPATFEGKTCLTALAEVWVEAKRKQDAAALANLESEINLIDYRLFALTPAEIAIIESSLPT